MKKFLILFLSLFSLGGTGITASAESGIEIKGPNLIQKEQYQILTLSDILAFYTSDSQIMIKEDNYSGNGAILGSHSIILKAYNDTESTEKEITIEVIQSIGYAVRAVTDKKDLHIAKTNTLKQADIVQVHARTGVFQLNQTSQASILTDNYSANASTPGVYLFEYRLMDASGLDIVVSCNITVYDSERIETPIIKIPKETSGFDLAKQVLVNAVSVVIILFLGYFVFKAVTKARNSKWKKY